MGKEIVIDKSKLMINLNWLLLGFLYSVVFLFLITIIFKEIISDVNWNDKTIYYSYYNSFLEKEYSGYDPTYGRQSLDILSLPEMLFNYYLPFVFIENLVLLIVMTVLIAIILKLFSFFTIKIK